MTPSDIAVLISSGVTVLVALGGLVVYFHRINNSIIERCENKIEAQRVELTQERTREVARLESMITDERGERRREIDRQERTISGYADVASAVVAMGKSIEHIGERQNDHQEQYKIDMSEVKSIIRGIESRLLDGNKKG